MFVARPHPALIELAAGRPITQPVRDPAWLVSSAQEHRLTGLLAGYVDDGVVALPRELSLELAILKLGVRAHHERLWRALGSITETLSEIEVEIASFKGVTSEARWYDRMGDRPCADLDLLLSPMSVHRVEAVLARIQPAHPLTGVAQSMIDGGHIQHIDLRVADVHVDMHVDMLKLLIPGRHQLEIWDRTMMIDFIDHPTSRVVDPEISLVQSLLHLTKDRFPFLLGYVEVMRIVERESLDWDYIDRFVRREGLEDAFYLGLNAVYSTLGLRTPVPTGASGWRPMFWKVLWSPQTRLLGTRGRVTHHRRQFWIPLLARGRFLEAVRKLWKLTFPPRELMDFYHPDTRGPYLWRLIMGRLNRGRERSGRLEDVAKNG